MGRAAVAAAVATVLALSPDDRRRLFRRLRDLGILRRHCVCFSVA
jgi:hypothetical protein